MPSPVRFAVVRRLLEAKGYALTKITGSHHKFTKPGEQPVSIPVHGNQVKHVYHKIAKEAS